MAGSTENDEELNILVDEITAGARGDDAQLRAFGRVFHDEVALPADAVIVGEPVTVLSIEYEGNERQGIVARCRKNRTEYLIGAGELAFPEGSTGQRYIAAYRTWIGIDPYLPGTHKAADDDIDMTTACDLVVLAVKRNALSCRILGKDRIITLRPANYWEGVPGEIITVSPRKKWRYANHPYLAGEITASRVDIPALGLTPLKLTELGIWDPKEHYWGEPDEPIEPWAKPIIKKGPRPEYEMAQVIPGENPDDPDTDPILEAVDLKEAGDSPGARRILMKLLAEDLRCLDAHAHLGNLIFNHDPDMAIRYYDMGVKIAELSLGKDFTGVLPWACTDNRPFLRCLHGYGLCLWRFNRFRDAEKLFTRMLWLNPTDNQGVRGELDEVKRREVWDDEMA
jgi:hypothetical protein